MRFYESLRKLTKINESYDIFSVKSLSFVPFYPITKYYWHFVILYRDKWNSSVCYRTVSPLEDIGKYFAIVKRKVIFPISQTLKHNGWVSLCQVSLGWMSLCWMAWHPTEPFRVESPFLWGTVTRQGKGARKGHVWVGQIFEFVKSIEAILTSFSRSALTALVYQ